MEKYISLLDTWVARAKTHPLTITLVCNSAKSDGLLVKCLNRHLTKFRSISLDLPSAAFRTLFSSDSLPLLERLSMACPKAELPLVLSQSAPMLHQVHLGRELWPYDVALPWQQLTSFECYERLTVADFLRLLRKTSKLVHCVVDTFRAIPLDTEAPPLPPHISLRHLTLKTVDVLDFISLPGLARLEIQGSIGLQDLIVVETFIARSQCELHEIIIRPNQCNPSLKRTVDLLATIPSLTHIQLTSDRSDAIAIVSAQLHCGNSPPILAHLQALSFRFLATQTTPMMFEDITNMLSARRSNTPLTSFSLQLGNVPEDAYPSLTIRERWKALSDSGMDLSIRTSHLHWI
jgi:hypothetical protein